MSPPNFVSTPRRILEYLGFGVDCLLRQRVYPSQQAGVDEDLGDPLYQRTDVKSFREVAAHSDGAVVLDDSSLPALQCRVDAVGQRLCAREGILGDADGAPQRDHHLVHDRWRLKARNRQDGGELRVGMHYGPDIGPVPVDRDVQQGLRRGCEVALQRLHLEVGHDDVVLVHLRVTLSGRRDRKEFAGVVGGQPDADVPT